MPTSPLSALDYCDWCDYAGLYLGNVSHADRYRSFQPKISPAGLATRIVFDFLQNNDSGIDVQAWRNGNVYEVGQDAAFRIEQTTLAMEAIGAPRLAAKIRAARNTSAVGALFDPAGGFKAMQEAMKNIDLDKLRDEFRANIARAKLGPAPTPPKPVPPDQDIESWEQVEHLLENYVHAHADDLRADMARHGDVRHQPGFDPDKRREELKRLYHKELDEKRQREEAKKARTLMSALGKQLVDNPKLKPSKAAKERREFLRVYREYAGRPADLVPEMQAWLAEAKSLQDKHRDFFIPKPTADKALLKRLADLGEYAVDVGSKRVKLVWDKPNGFDCDWTGFLLSLTFPAKNNAALAALLDAVDRVRLKFAVHQADMRREVLQHFEIYREIESRLGFDGHELDAAGNPTEPSILKKAGGGGIHFAMPDNAADACATIDVFFHVDWDEEHGLELCIVDEPPVQPAEEIATAILLEPGPAITSDDIAAFEKEYQIQFPAEYRDFLMRQNGGRPEPNHLRVKMEWGAISIYIERFYSLETPSTPKQSDMLLSEAIALHMANDYPADYAPIGQARISSPSDGPARTHLLIGLSGKNEGEILIAFGLGDAMCPEFESTCRVIAPSLGVLLARLTPV